MSIVFNGLDKFCNKLTTAVKKLPAQKDKFLMQEAELLRGYAVNNTPVDTGTLRNGWKRTNTEGNSVTVYNNTEYANHVEWGHRLSNGGFVPGAKMLHHAIKNADDNFKADTKDIMEGIFDG